MKYLYSILLLILSFPCCILSAKGEEDDLEPHRFGLTGYLTSSDTWQVDISYHYMLTRNIGLGGAAGFWEQYYIDGYPSGRNWHIDDEDEKLSNFYIRPSILLLSPTLFHLGQFDVRLSGEPGIMMNIPYRRVCIDIVDGYHTVDYKYVSTGKGQWCAFDCKIGVDFNFLYGSLAAGYLFSTFDIFGLSRNLSFDGTSFSQFYPDRKVIHGAYISAVFQF